MSDPVPLPIIHIPLSPVEKKLKKHAILSSVGFIILIPIGVLVARYLRNFTRRWFWAHAAIQFVISGPIIFAGWALGYQSTSELFTGGHFFDRHRRIGLALLILYLTQLLGGTFIHFIKLPFRGGRPPQNYIHAVLGLTIIALAFYQVHYGLYTEWYEATQGSLTVIPASARHAWLALIIIFWVLYGLGLLFLRRQYRQEAVSRAPINEKDVNRADSA